MNKNFYPVYLGGNLIGHIDRTFADDIAVKLPCGYYQRFWLDLTDVEVINKCRDMKDLGITSN